MADLAQLHGSCPPPFLQESLFRSGGSTLIITASTMSSSSLLQSRCERALLYNHPRGRKWYVLPMGSIQTLF